MLFSRIRNPFDTGFFSRAAEQIVSVRAEGR
jgi:hypothetical protein